MWAQHWVNQITSSIMSHRVFFRLVSCVASYGIASSIASGLAISATDSTGRGDRFYAAVPSAPRTISAVDQSGFSDLQVAQAAPLAPPLAETDTPPTEFPEETEPSPVARTLQGTLSFIILAVVVAVLLQTLNHYGLIKAPRFIKRWGKRDRRPRRTASRSKTSHHDSRSGGWTPTSPNHPASADAADEPAVMQTLRFSSSAQKADLIKQLLQDLHSLDPAKRRKAIWELGQQGDSDAIQPLADLMVESDSKQRCLVLAAISEIGLRTLKPVNHAFLLSIRDQSGAVRKDAIREVTRIYDPIVQVGQLLHRAVEDSDPEVRKTAQWALERFSHIQTLPELENSSSPILSELEAADVAAQASKMPSERAQSHGSNSD